MVGLFVGVSYKLTIMILLHGFYEGEMKEQQELLLLWLHLGEYGKNSSDTFHEISREKEGTFMVKGGYPSTLKDHERLPCRKEIFSHISMMVDGYQHDGGWLWHMECQREESWSLITKAYNAAT